MVTSAAAQLTGGAAPLWERLTRHPFVVAAGDGTLDPRTFDRWLVEDYAYVVGFRRFLAGLVTISADDAARDVLCSALNPLQTELELFREQAAHRGLDLDTEPGPTTLGYASYVQASLQDGYRVALTVLYGAELAYHDAWRAVREQAQQHSPYWPFIGNWSSPAFGAWVTDIAALLDAAAPNGANPDMVRAFGRVVRFELRFWDAVYAGERW